MSGNVSVRPSSAGSFGLTPERERTLIWAFLWLGLAARVLRYVLRFPLWEDECFLCVNYIGRGYAELLQPLDYHQIAPVLFLWAELAVVRLLGYTEWTLRLIPFLCSVASLFLFRHLAGRLLAGVPLLLAVAAFSVGYPGIRYAAEAKQYGSDLFVSLVLLVMAVQWQRRPESSRWLWGLTAVLPLAIGLSYPAVFVAGGVSLFIAWTLWTERCWTGGRGSRRAASGIPPWSVVAARREPRPPEPDPRQKSAPARFRYVAAWAAYNVVLVASFVGWLLVAGSQQTAGEMGTLTNYWTDGFPPWRPLALLKWLVVAHTSDLLAWPVGGERGASTLTFVCVAAGVAALWRTGRREWLLLCLTPFALQLTAAALHRYPYGVHVKFSQHLAPLICILSGAGGAVLLEKLFRRPARGMAVSLALLAAVGAGSIIRDIHQPYKTRSDLRARAFAQWFWFNAAFDGQAVCLHTDLHKDFSPETWADLSWSAMYLCNQRIYSPRHARQQPFDPSRVAADHPLRCVLYRDPQYDFDEPRLKRWLADMQSRYDLAAREVYPFPRYGKRERELLKVDYLESFKFVPKAETGGARDRLAAEEPIPARR